MIAAGYQRGHAVRHLEMSLHAVRHRLMIRLVLGQVIGALAVLYPAALQDVQVGYVVTLEASLWQPRVFNREAGRTSEWLVGAGLCDRLALDITNHALALLLHLARILTDERHS